MASYYSEEEIISSDSSFNDSFSDQNNESVYAKQEKNEMLKSNSSDNLNKNRNIEDKSEKVGLKKDNHQENASLNEKTLKNENSNSTPENNKQTSQLTHLVTPKSSYQQQNKEQLEQKKKQTIISKKNILPALIILISVMFSFSYFKKMTSDKSIKTNSNISSGQTIFEEKIKLIKLKYPNLTSKFWANIESTYRHSIVKSKDPSIILIVNEKTDSKLAYNISFDILNLIKTSIDKEKSNIKDLIINSSDLNCLSDPKRVKIEIDNKLNYLFASGEKVTLIRNIEFIPAEVMLLFMSYGDDFANARYTGVIILMTLEIKKLEVKDKDSFLKSSRQMTQYIEGYLLDLWSKFIGEDQLIPIFTRIANNVLFV